MDDFERVKLIKEEHETILLKKENVVGVGVGKKNKTGELCIKVYVVRKVPEDALNPDDIIPKIIEGVRTDVVESGIIQLQKSDQ